MREAKHRITMRTREFKPIERLQSAIEHRAADAAPLRGRRETHAVTERPQCATATVMRSDGIDPAAIVTHEVVEAPVVELRIVQEREVRGGEAQRSCVARIDAQAHKG